VAIELAVDASVGRLAGAAVLVAGCRRLARRQTSDGGAGAGPSEATPRAAVESAVADAVRAQRLGGRSGEGGRRVVGSARTLGGVDAAATRSAIGGIPFFGPLGSREDSREDGEGSGGGRSGRRSSSDGGGSGARTVAGSGAGAQVLRLPSCGVEVRCGLLARGAGAPTATLGTRERDGGLLASSYVEVSLLRPGGGAVCLRREFTRRGQVARCFLRNRTRSRANTTPNGTEASAAG
jgi:hypothetical protein